MLAYIILSSILIIALSGAAAYFYKQAGEKQKLEAEVHFLNEKIREQEKQKTENIEITKELVKTGALEAATTLSNKLLDDHKRESERAKKESEEAIKKTTEELSKSFSEIYKNINILNEKVETVDVIRRSLLTPSGAGLIAELTLENIFKASNLSELDYKLQYVINDGEKTFRPDAIVFLTNDDVLIVDSKSSSIFIELDNQSEDASEKDLLQRLKASMSRHLKELADKKYTESLKNALSKIHGQKINNVITAMFIPSDIAWNKVREADPVFFENAIKQQVFPCGPTGLTNILINSRFALMRERQNRNYDHIIDKIRKMIGQMADLYESARKVGSGIDMAARHYEDFANRFNKQFLNEARDISDSISLPAKFPEQNLSPIAKKSQLIEGKAEEIKELEKTN